jgi:hypothetical protein
MKKRALIVGINYTGTGNDLKGCINDANNVHAFLKNRGFEETKLILEKEATTDGIKAGLEWLVAGAQPGDILYFHYSGHGSQLPSKTEADGFEEIICPYDLNWRDKVITDDTLRQIFNKVPSGVNTTLFLDCCHSGNMLDQTESLDETKEVQAKVKRTRAKKKDIRYLKPPVSVLKKLAKRKLVDWQTSRDVNRDALLIAACQENQTAADAFIDGTSQGAATASMLRILKSSPDQSYRGLVLSMRDFMKANRFSQIPDLDGSSALYDTKFIEPFNLPPEPVVIDPVVEPVIPVSDGSNENNKKDKKKETIIIAAVLIAVIIFAIIAA